MLFRKRLSSENLVAMFFFCNTHYVVAAAQFLWRGWIWICCSVHSPGGVTELAESIHPLPPPSAWLNEWRCRVVMAWCLLTDGLLVWWRIAAFPMQRRSRHRRSRKRSRSFEDDGEGHLIYHIGDMLRARCIEYTLFFPTVLFVSRSGFVWFLFPNINLPSNYLRQ